MLGSLIYERISSFDYVILFCIKAECGTFATPFCESKGGRSAVIA